MNHYKIIPAPGVFPAETPCLAAMIRFRSPFACRSSIPILAGPVLRYGALAWLLLAALFTAYCSEALAQDKRAARSDVEEKRGDLKELRGQIDTLRKEMSATEGKRATAADQLKGIEQDISTTQRELHQLGNQRQRLQTTLKDLGIQARELEARLKAQQEQIERLAYRQYLTGQLDALRLLLNGDDPHQAARDLYYLAAIGQARRQLVEELGETLQRKQTLAANTHERADELAAVENKQKQQHDKLLGQRGQRKAMLDQFSAQIASQRKEIGNLQRDEKQLTQLIDKLNKIIAAQQREAAKREAAQREAARREAARPPSTRPKTTTPRPSDREIDNDKAPDASASGNFPALQGHLRLPARGTVTNRFGSPRQEGSSWKGLFIRAAAGSEVKAVASGRVVFADWMRGFGNLLIVDHGSQYLSIYGNNDALLKQVGDAVRGGDTVASVGNSGGNPESGLYFELRYRGQPIDPLKWVNLK